MKLISNKGDGDLQKFSSFLTFLIPLYQINLLFPVSWPTHTLLLLLARGGGADVKLQSKYGDVTGKRVGRASVFLC